MIFDDNMIYFDLGRNDEDIDSFGIQFDDKDRDIYLYVAIRFMISLLRCVVIHRDENILFNDYHKPYLSVIIEDRELLSMMVDVIEIQKNEILTDRMELVNNLYNQIDDNKIVSIELIRNIDNRVEIAKKLLKEIKL